MRNNTSKRIALCSLVVTFMAPSITQAGNLEPTAAPESAASAVYNTDDIYNRLQTGAAGAKRTVAFMEPTAGPADGVGKTLDQIMTAAPAMDNVNGALPADVKIGKTYWGLRTDSGGTWGTMTGTATVTWGASPAPVPKTGQLVSYAAGDDGAKQKGVDIPSPRFTNNGNGTVTDNLTGLIWLTNANCTETVGGIAKASGKLEWANALTWSSSLANGHCGLADGSAAGDWRLPNKKELLSLLNVKYFDPALSNAAGTGKWTEGDPFSNVQTTQIYWTSTAWSLQPLYNRWCVKLPDGYLHYWSPDMIFYVWPVRGGQ